MWLCAFKWGGGCRYSLSCFEYLIQSSHGINDFNILSLLIFKCHFIFSIHEFVYCGIQACDECVYRTLIIPIRMEIKWLHDGNLEEEKQRLEFIKHVWGKIESLTQCLCLQCGNLQLCSPKLYYTCVYIYVCVCVCVCACMCVCIYICMA